MINEQISIFDGTKRFQIDKPIRLIELFAGIGAQAKALENLGVPFEHYKICEFNEAAVVSYNAIHGTAFLPSDITKINAKDLKIIDTNKYCYITTYSFPCTDLSKEGKTKGMDKGSGTRSGLLWQVERLLDEAEELPQVLLMENVPEVIGGRNKKAFSQWIEKLDSLGYRSYWQILNAADFGIPQNRARCFMVSILGDYYYTFPRPHKLTVKASDYYDNSDLNINILPQNTTARNLILYADDQIAYIKQATKRGYIDLKNNGLCCLSFPNSARRRGRVIRGGDVSPTLMCGTPEIYKFIDGEFYRINNLEKFRLMGFNDEDFRKVEQAGITSTDASKQAGNSIVVNVLMAIFKNML